MGTGGGGGENHGATVMGNDFIDIHAGQPPAFPSAASSSRPASEPFLLLFESVEPPPTPLKSKLLLFRPTFLRAILVVKLDSIVIDLFF